jgi:hypothetical protein
VCDDCPSVLIINPNPVIAVEVIGLTPILPVIDVTPVVEMPDSVNVTKLAAPPSPGSTGPSATVAVKFAVIFLFAFMVTVNGFTEPEASPLHDENTKPAFGVAVSCTVVPKLYVAWVGFLVTVPFTAVTFKVNVFIAKLATNVLLAFNGKV